MAFNVQRGWRTLGLITAAIAVCGTLAWVRSIWIADVFYLRFGRTACCVTSEAQLIGVTVYKFGKRSTRVGRWSSVFIEPADVRILSRESLNAYDNQLSWGPFSFCSGVVGGPSGRATVWLIVFPYCVIALTAIAAVVAACYCALRRKEEDAAREVV